MSFTWQGEAPPPAPPIGPAGWLRVVLLGAVLAVVLGVGIVVLLLLRLVERPFSGLARPVSGWVPRLVSRIALAVLGIRLKVLGRPMRGRGGMMVANHSSWLDIFVLNASICATFVSKAEVAGWPGIGFLARIAGTVFINRTAREAGAQRRMFEDQLGAGARLVVFPEGTSTDGRRVLPFKSTVFAAIFTDHLTSVPVQPVSICYHAPPGQDPRFYAWWGDMDFGPHALKLLATGAGGHVELIWHDVRDTAGSDRKSLAKACELAVRAGVDGARDHAPQP